MVKSVGSYWMVAALLILLIMFDFLLPVLPVVSQALWAAAALVLTYALNIAQSKLSHG